MFFNYLVKKESRYFKSFNDFTTPMGLTGEQEEAIVSKIAKAVSEENNGKEEPEKDSV